MPGADGVSTSQFARHLTRNIDELATRLRDGTYRAQPLRTVRMRREFKERTLGIPTVRDRVAQRAFLEVFGPRFDARLAENTFAYRKGRSWLDALRAVERARDRGYPWVLRADIETFFDSIDHGRLRADLDATLGSPALVDLLMAWVQAPALDANGLETRAVGVPQGAPISPALANQFLRDVDAEIDGVYGQLVRYADDLVVLCRDDCDAVMARSLVEAALACRGLRLNLAKTYVSSFRTGFSFPGWTFVRDGGYEESPNERWVHPLAYRSAPASSRY